jgi:hypothetical protein
MAYPTVMTPEREAEAWRLLEAGTSRKAAALALGVSENAAGKWARRVGRRWADGRTEAGRTPAQQAVSRAHILAANRASAAKRRLPLTAEERAAYQRIYVKGVGLLTRDDCFRAIGRPDLVGWTSNDQPNSPGGSSPLSGHRPPQSAACRAATKECAGAGLNAAVTA